MKKVTAMEEIFERKCIQGYHVAIKKSMGSGGWRVGAQNASDHVAVKKELKGITGVFAVFATGR